MNSLKFYIFLFTILTLSCKKETEIKTVDELKKYFTASPKKQRFKNTHIWARDVVSEDVKQAFFPYWSDSTNTKLYRITAPNQTKDSVYTYFLYGVSDKADNFRTLRMCSFKDGISYHDTLLFSLEDSLEIDYWFIDSTIIVYRANEEGIHHSSLKLVKGKLQDETLIPPTIFRRKDFIPEKGDRIKVFNDFDTEKLQIGNQSKIVTGKVVMKIGGGKGCSVYMIVELDNPFRDSLNYLVTNPVINQMSRLFGLKNAKLKKVFQCDIETELPADTLVDLKTMVYIKYN